jgi:hypothetical protein
MPKVERLKMLKLIKRNIQQFGFHIYFFTGGNIPRFVYTIGLMESIKAELIIAGAIFYTGDEVKRIINTILSANKIE